ncbi:MAG: hypothetical protein A2X82_00720 [Geobacteraceae bacterium GWC2_55_20]|nr:MAG: hypothetical protein A2X82_00720 [Geobacteraceae bacterium GWC2_55_20]OGU18795.1 MAG: hypothetical protein A2X85_13795 [Geobacteraceae bacterium GWF2_54_21]HCE69219.1 hypothetical protein [Geobacter sp.]
MRCRFSFAFLSLLLLLPSVNSFAVTRDEIKSALEARYRYTVPGFFGDFKAIGSVLVVQEEGLRQHRPSALFKQNVIAGGRITASGGSALTLGGNLDGSLKVGDRLYLYGISSGDDYVELNLFTVKTFVVTGSGTRGPTPLQATTRFRYDGGLAGVSSRQVMNDIAHWFRTEEEARRAPDGTATRTIRLGQTRDEVVAIFGAPEKEILLGSKTVLVYRDVKVVFVDGRVTDSE